MLLESLKNSKFEPLSKEQLKNVKGGDDAIPTKPNNGAAAGWVAWHGKNYWCSADSYTMDKEHNYTSMKVYMDGTWTDIFNQ